MKVVRLKKVGQKMTKEEASSSNLTPEKIDVYKGLQELNATMGRVDAYGVIEAHLKELEKLRIVMGELYDFVPEERTEDLFKIMSRIVQAEVIGAFIGVHIMDSIDEFYPELKFYPGLKVMVTPGEQTCNSVATVTIGDEE